MSWRGTGLEAARSFRGWAWVGQLGIPWCGVFQMGTISPPCARPPSHCVVPPALGFRVAPSMSSQCPSGRLYLLGICGHSPLLCIPRTTALVLSENPQPDSTSVAVALLCSSAGCSLIQVLSLTFWVKSSP